MPPELRLVVDASTFVGEALRIRGRELIAHPTLSLFITVEQRDEARYETGRRLSLLESRGSITSDQARSLALALDEVYTSVVTTVDRDVYEHCLGEAVRRIPADPADAPAIALALTLECGIWTSDRDFFGCGVATWTSTVIRSVIMPDEHLST